jgi:hypothetical protein
MKPNHSNYQLVRESECEDQEDYPSDEQMFRDIAGWQEEDEQGKANSSLETPPANVVMGTLKTSRLSKLLENTLVPFTSGFRTRLDLEDHFDAHGAEFSAEDEEAYLALADEFLGGAKKQTTLEGVRRRDQATIRYDYVSQEFGILSRDGYIVTYFKPDPAYHGKSTNREYFMWECNRR